ncbi:hypothetical protein M514_20972 [Trichuris suis]|uniref:Uncharacterized protein n=1 Tax=Trichuris suis TaxID=68888 RepID=A0A085NBI2_9BILA|nr:hypothetical protein M514_20972 [Trichuris suis]
MPKNVAWFLARYLQFPFGAQMTSQDEDGRGDSSNDGSSTIRPVSDPQISRLHSTKRILCCLNHAFCLSIT